MPNSELAKEEKVKAWKVIEQSLGIMVKPTGRPDWRITKDEKVSVVIKFSKYDDRSHTFWYGLNPDNLEQWSRYERSFIVFLIGKYQERLVIPITQLELYIGKSDIQLSKSNQIKLHIVFEKGRYLFTEFRDFDTSEFYNIDLLKTDSVISKKDTFVKSDSKIEEEIKFNPKNIEDARDQIMKSIFVRRGQRKFRKILLNEFERRCAITGCTVEEILEAAHIIPYKGEHTNKLANGLLLRADIHTLFDLGFISIDTNTMTVIIDSALSNTEYKQFSGMRLKAKPRVLENIKLVLDERQIINKSKRNFKNK